MLRTGGLALLLPAANAFAAEGGMEGAALQAVGGLAIVLGAIALLAWLGKRVGKGAQASRGPLAALASLSVGPRERVVLVRCADSWVLVGVAPGRVSALHTLPCPPDAPVDAAAPQPASAGSFRQWLEKATGRRES